MALTLYLHPIASFCQKVLIALYENGTTFERHIVDLGNEGSAAEYMKLWPVGKMPLLRDGERVIPESSIIIEHLDRHHPGKTPLVPIDPALALETRLKDRFFDSYVMHPMQKIVTDRIRPAGKNDAYGVEVAKAQLRTAYDMIERDMHARSWANGDAFSMADCAAAPALFFANWVVPFGDTHPHAAAYLDRSMKRPSIARVYEEAKPYFHLFPQG